MDYNLSNKEKIKKIILHVFVYVPFKAVLRRFEAQWIGGSTVPMKKN